MDFNGFDDLPEPPPKKTPKRQFKGLYIPRKALRLLQKNKINASELMIFMTIDSLTKPGVGCYASNAYLANCIGYENPNSIGNMISELKKKHLIRQVSFDGKTRYLDTVLTPVKRKAHPSPNSGE